MTRRRVSWSLVVVAVAAGVAALVYLGVVSGDDGGDGVATGFVQQSLGSQASAVSVGDVTGDGRADIVMTTNSAGGSSNSVSDFRLFVIQQEADGRLATPAVYETAGSFGNQLKSVTTGDVTGDGRDDVVLGVDELGVQVFPQLPSGLLGEPTMTSTEDGRLVRLGHLDGDDQLDVAALGFGTETVSVLLNDGDGELRTPVEFPARHGGFDDLEVSDVTGDGRDDLVVMSGQGNDFPNVSVLEQLSDGGFGPPAEYDVGAAAGAPDHENTHGLGIGDVTGDGRSDVVVTFGLNSPSGRLAVFAQASSGALDPPVFYPSYDLPGAVDVGDIDADGRLDAVALHVGWKASGVYLQKSDGSLGEEDLVENPSGRAEPHGFEIADVNSDGTADIVIADADDGLYISHTRP